MDRKDLNEDGVFSTDMPVGEIFRRTRLHYGQSLQDIERALRIRASQIEAIERGNIEKLPGRVYAIGFVRSYAEYLGLDGDKMVHLFKVQIGGKAPRPQLQFPVSASESKMPPLWLVAASLSAGLLFLLGWWGFQGTETPAVSDISPVEAPVSATPEPELEPEPTAAPAAPVQTLAAPPAPKGIILNIVENSWVEIRDKTGQPVVARVLKAGERYYVPDRPDLKMSLGNAGGISVEIDGQALAPLGEAGEVRRDIPLDAVFLKQTYVAPDPAVAPPAEAEIETAPAASPPAPAEETPAPAGVTE